MLALSFLPLLLLATAGLAASSPGRRATPSGVPASVLAQLLPANQQQLVAPTDAPTFVALVTGFHNFTCTRMGTWASEGFAGQLFDISSLFPGPEFSQIQNDVYFSQSASTDPFDLTFAKQVEDKYGIPLSGQHYFASSGVTGLASPVFDFRNNGPTAGNSDAIVVADVTGHIPAPTGISDLDWQVMTGTSGKFASTVFRVSTKGGVLNLVEACEPNTPGLQAKFTAQLFFYGSKL
ncbi:hypothetical protein EDB92DRAFT_1945440 [Lactarius akahatsu]|uniref:Uncharacterized protein n=1 Tax=Lactarius akahatsu TaxID=416441 RepID=A0AAD4LHW4_9AGAM|nr:hypothetical protein EDB92DRAFT_1945440 [Lactarius akahatsu]